MQFPLIFQSFNGSNLQGLLAELPVILGSFSTIIAIKVEERGDGNH